MDSNAGIFNKKDPDTNNLDTDKHWWPQAEGMVGLVNAFQISDNPVYIDKFLELWDFIRTYIIDNGSGEWYWKVNDKGLPYDKDEKAGFWKCPYHNSRACIEVISRISDKV
jgi:mannobiose 2-epimerase